MRTKADSHEHARSAPRLAPVTEPAAKFQAGLQPVQNPYSKVRLLPAYSIMKATCRFCRLPLLLHCAVLGGTSHSFAPDSYHTAGRKVSHILLLNTL